MGDIILDISRLISRIHHSTPSGVDRVEMAYARGLLAQYGDDLAFAAVHPFGIYGRVHRRTALAYLDELERRWASGNNSRRRASWASTLFWLAALRPSRPKPPASAGRAVYVQASPHHLTREETVRAILRRERASFLCMIHDLIPIEFPEYARPSGATLHERRMTTVARLADAVVVNSAATGRSWSNWLGTSGRSMSIHVALLGTAELPLAEPAAAPQSSPYFVCIGTIEPRKNHLLLLHVWRRMVETLPKERVPRLMVIGRRGWENEQVVDMLERCSALRDYVQEINDCSDAQMAALLGGARALLMPSFAEGYGMPVAEALSAGIPVLCSDLPALREVGGAIPDYLDPLDGPAWLDMIINHFQMGPSHSAQMVRLRTWRSPTWESHIATVVRAIEALRQRPTI